jgi:hypothetical protein
MSALSGFWGRIAAPQPWGVITGTAIWRWVVLALILVGVVARLSPLTDPSARLFWQYMTEDGYLMQTIARNMAIGLGMTTAEGTIQTNGVQPLVTFLFSAMHWLAGGDKAWGVALVTMLSALFSMLGAYLLYRVMRQVFSNTTTLAGQSSALAGLIAAAWFASPHIVPISMNGLETSLYHLAVLTVCGYYLGIASAPGVAMTWTQRAVLGLLLGVAFLSRNDAVFFIAAVLLVHLLYGGASRHGGVGRRLVDCIVAGMLSVVVASPWLVYNYELFGSIVPISGTAQSHSAALGMNLKFIPSKIFEVFVPFLPLPNSLETKLPVIAVSILLPAVLLALFLRLAGTSADLARRFVLIGCVFGAGLCTYYGVFFGADWFLARYLSVLAVFFWPAAATVVFVLILSLFERVRWQSFAATLVLVAMLGLSAAFAASAYAKGQSHMHRQVVDWVSENVPDSAWVGAPQTGTLGYFHDRTINLDGKVNPAALRVLLNEGHILNYVAASEIDYIVDWVGMADWPSLGLSPAFEQQFEVIVRDPELNLAALRRRGAPQK